MEKGGDSNRMRNVKATGRSQEPNKEQGNEMNISLIYSLTKYDSSKPSTN